jgi:hypothetical protein
MTANHFMPGVSDQKLPGPGKDFVKRKMDSGKCDKCR